MENKILSHLKIVDHIIYAAAVKVVKVQPLEKLKPLEAKDYFEDLCEAITSQQLSGKVSDVIFARFKKLYPKVKITAKYTLIIPDEKIRAAGMSNSKVKFIKDLAEKVESGNLKMENLAELSDEQVTEELMKVKGIGTWTAEMFLMFGLAREDIFSHGDLGLRRAIQKLYGLKKEPTERQTARISKKWSPFKTYACMILWRSLDL